MSHLKSDSEDSQSFADLNSPASIEIKQLIANIEHSHNMRYKMMNLEAWALVETMDTFLPGFWNRFLKNRQKSLKEFLERKRTSSL